MSLPFPTSGLRGRSLRFRPLCLSLPSADLVCPVLAIPCIFGVLVSLPIRLFARMRGMGRCVGFALGYFMRRPLYVLFIFVGLLWCLKSECAAVDSLWCVGIMGNYRQGFNRTDEIGRMGFWAGWMVAGPIAPGTDGERRT